MKIMTPDEFLQGGSFTNETATKTTQAQPQKPSVFADLAIGAAKGLGDTVMGVGELGRKVQSVLPGANQGLPGAGTPAQGKTGIFDQGSQLNTQATETLKSDNPTQTTGKVLEFATEVLFPTGLVSKGAKATGATLKGLGSRIASLGDETAEGGVRIKDQLIDAVTNLDDKTKTALSRTPREVFDKFVQQGKDAMMDDRNRTPLEAVGDQIIEGLTQVKNRASQAGQAKSQIMEQAKVGYKKVGNIAQRSALDIQKAFNGMKLDDADMKVVSTFQQKLKSLGDNPSLKDVDATIDLLQDQLYKKGSSSVVEVTDRVTGKLRRELTKLNDQVKKLGGKSYAQLNDEYADLIGTVTELNTRLGKEGASAGSFVKRLFSPSDARTKELFDKLEELTGQDFTRDARLAKFIMETLGDSRAKSLLEQLPDPSPSGLLGKAFEFAKDKLTDPLKSAERFIDRR